LWRLPGFKRHSSICQLRIDQVMKWKAWPSTNVDVAWKVSLSNRLKGLILCRPYQTENTFNWQSKAVAKIISFHTHCYISRCVLVNFLYWICTKYLSIKVKQLTVNHTMIIANRRNIDRLLFNARSTVFNICILITITIQQ
jgi:hypothetical protein